MRPNVKTPNYIAYALAMIVVVVAIVFYSYAKHVPGLPRYEVSAVLPSSNQLTHNSPVRIAGVKVGSIVSIEEGANHTEILTMAIDEDQAKLHTDASLKIRPRMFLEGGFYVELHPGSPSAPRLKDNGRIPAGRAKIPVQFDQLLSTLDLPTREGLKSTFSEFSEALKKGGAEGFQRFALTLPKTVRNIAISSDAGAGTKPHDVSDIVTYAGRTVAALDRSDRALVGVLDGLDRTAGATAAESQNLTDTFKQVDATLKEAPSTLDAVDRALPRLEAASRAVRPALPIAPRALRASAALVRQANGLLSQHELPDLTRAIGPLVRGLPTLADRLKVLMPLVDQVTTCTQRSVLPVLRGKLDDGHLTTNRPVYLDLVQSFVGLASATQNFDGNGNYIRLLGNFGTNSVVTGQIPEEGQVFSNGLGGLIGSRPKPLPPGTLPVFRPDADCRDQKVPDLKAQTAPPDFTAIPPNSGKVRQVAKTPGLLKQVGKWLAKTRKEAAR